MRHTNTSKGVIRPTCTILHLTTVYVLFIHLTDRDGALVPTLHHTLLGMGTNNEEASVYVLI